MIDKTDIEKLRRFSGELVMPKKSNTFILFLLMMKKNPEFERILQKEFNEYLKTHLEENYNLSYLLDQIHQIIYKQEYQNKDTVVKKNI